MNMDKAYIDPLYLLKPTEKMLTNLYKPRAYIRNLKVFLPIAAKDSRITARYTQGCRENSGAKVKYEVSCEGK